MPEYLWPINHPPPSMGPLTPSKRTFLKMAALALVMLVSGCITIEEHYTFRKNGGGTMEYVMDMSALGAMMDALDQGGKARKKGKGEQEPMATGMEEHAKALRQLQGIKHVKLKLEKDGFVQRISFSFADLAALNSALNVLMPDSTGPPHAFFRWEGSTLVRTSNRYASALGKDMSGGADSTNLSGMLQSMRYKFSFNFPRKVEQADVAQGFTRASPSPRKLELATDWSVIMKDTTALDLRITLGK